MRSERLFRSSIREIPFTVVVDICVIRRLPRGENSFPTRSLESNAWLFCLTTVRVHTQVNGCQTSIVQGLSGPRDSLLRFMSDSGPFAGAKHQLRNRCFILGSELPGERLSRMRAYESSKNVEKKPLLLAFRDFKRRRSRSLVLKGR